MQLNTLPHILLYAIFEKLPFSNLEQKKNCTFQQNAKTWCEQSIGSHNVHFKVIPSVFATSLTLELICALDPYA